jgi:hypothetical protein
MRNDTWLRVVGISLLNTLSILSSDEYHLPLTGQLVVSLLVKIASIVLNWAIIAYFHHKALPQTAAIGRLGSTLLACVLATTLFSWGSDALQYSVAHGTLANFRVNSRSIYLSLGDHTFQMSR